MRQQELAIQALGCGERRRVCECALTGLRAPLCGDENSLQWSSAAAAAAEYSTRRTAVMYCRRMPPVPLPTSLWAGLWPWVLPLPLPPPWRANTRGTALSCTADVQACCQSLSQTPHPYPCMLAACYWPIPAGPCTCEPWHAAVTFTGSGRCCWVPCTELLSRCTADTPARA